jgi:enamine deaminase RidA (YjgF/YER057c/UK114 family)
MAEVSEEKRARLQVCFGQEESRLITDDAGISVAIRIPHLAGPATETILETTGQIESTAPGSVILAGPQWLAGAIVRPLRGPLDDLAHSTYRELLIHARGWSLARIWNYVPDINAETTGLENYRRFNLGRWQAFHDAFGRRMAAHLPAASAVGLSDDRLVTVFLATRQPIRAIENPRQVPAWNYPEAYGPKAPSFVRGTLTGEPGRRRAWISGTASIRGHESIHPGDAEAQLTLTLDNLAVVLESMGLPPLNATGQVTHQAKVYLRHRRDLDRVAGALADRGLPSPGPDGTVFLEAAVCRAELELEIEVATIEGGTLGGAG